MAGADVDYTFRLQHYPMHNEAVRAAADTLAAERAQGKNSKGSPEKNMKTLRDRVIESIQNKESLKESVDQSSRKKSVVSRVQSNKNGKLRVLLANGANPNEMHSYYHKTALEIAVQEKAKPSIIIDLILYGADKNVADNALAQEIQNIMLDIQQTAAIDLGNMIEPVKDAEQKKSTTSHTSNKKSPKKDQNKPSRTGPKI